MGAMSRRAYSALTLLALLVATTAALTPASAQSGEFVILLESPAPGETLYAGPSSLLYTIEVRGWVLGSPDPSLVSVKLEVIQGDAIVEELTTSPEQDGSYAFPITVNPHGSDGNFTAAEVESGCENCHYAVSASLPAGQLQLRVTATDVNASQAVAVRSITVDRSSSIMVPVRVVLAGDHNTGLPGMPVEASTRIYEWRARQVLGRTDEDGNAALLLEALSQAPTHYTLQVPPVLRDGVFYEGAGVLELTIPAGGSEVPTAILEVGESLRTLRGSVQVSGPEAPFPIDIWAIRLTDKHPYQTTTDELGRFTFTRLPAGRYLVTADAAWLHERNSQIEPELAELTPNVGGTVRLSLSASDGSLVQGTLLDEHGASIPFGEVSVESSSISGGVLPSLKAWRLNRAPDSSFSATAMAPGFIPQQVEIDPESAEPALITLQPQPDTRRIDWGTGEILLPPESQVTVGDANLRLDYGWLWGSQDGQDQMTVRTPTAEIVLRGGAFALEVVPERSNRLFVYQGSATVASPTSGTTTQVLAGQMLDLSYPDRSLPVSQEPVVDAALEAEFGLDLPRSWTSLDSGPQLTPIQSLIQGAAGIVTLVTYYLVLLILFATPFIGLYLWVHGRRGSRP